MKIQTFEGKQFSWQGQIGISEASSLGFDAGVNPPMAMRVRSHRTGKVVNLLYVGTNQRADDGGAFVYVAPSGVAIHVYND